MTRGRYKKITLDSFYNIPIIYLSYSKLSEGLSSLLFLSYRESLLIVENKSRVAPLAITRLDNPYISLARQTTTIANCFRILLD